MEYPNLNELIGKVMLRVEQTSEEEIVFETVCGKQYRLYYEHD